MRNQHAVERISVQERQSACLARVLMRPRLNDLRSLFPAHASLRRARVPRMNNNRRPSSLFLSLCVVGALATLPVSALAAVHFQKETLPAYEQQLAHHQVHADAFHPGAAGANGHLHVSLNDGRHMSVSYAAAEQARLIAQARAKGVRVRLATVKAKSTKPVKHTLRYIAGGILIVVILVVLAVLLVGRRRRILEQAQGAATGEQAAGSAAGGTE